MQLIALVLSLLVASISHVAAQGKGMIPEIRVGTNICKR